MNEVIFEVLSIALTSAFSRHTCDAVNFRCVKCHIFYFHTLLSFFMVFNSEFFPYFSFVLFCAGRFVFRWMLYTNSKMTKNRRFGTWNSLCFLDLLEIVMVDKWFGRIKENVSSCFFCFLFFKKKLWTSVPFGSDICYSWVIRNIDVILKT